MVKPKDPFWNGVEEMDSCLKCKFCGFEFATTTSISRIKRHLSGVGGLGINICKRVPDDVKAAACLAIQSPNKRLRLTTPSSSDNEVRNTASTSSRDQTNQVDNGVRDAGMIQRELWSMGQLMREGIVHEDQTEIIEELMLHDERGSFPKGPAIDAQEIIGNSLQTAGLDLVGRAILKPWREIESFLMEDQRLNSDTEKTTGELMEPIQTEIDEQIYSALEYEAFESRRLVLNEIVKALKDADLRMIGVYGMSGVGKTTLVKKVAQQVKEDGIFDKVILAHVSETLDLRRIQGEIADDLHFKPDAETVKGRANQLRKRIKMENKILVILDNIWARFELEDVGIPLGRDHRGCKVLMTSRSRSALTCEMGAQKNFRLDVLPAKEAWNLFKKMVADVEDPSLPDVAEQVAERCAGLPLLLVTVARALKNGDLNDWKDALVKLKRFDSEEMDAQVYSAFELSYNFLKGDEIKSLFLLCGQLQPYCIPIQDLLKYAVGLGLFKRCTTLKEARTRLHKLVNDLKASCLLLEGCMDASVKMHDLIYKFAISTAWRDHNAFIVACGSELKEWPAQDLFSRFTAISLDNFNIPDLPEVFECPNLNSFLLYSNNPSLKICDNFFEGMKKLKLMDLSGMHLSSLPTSLQFLDNLQTLCLDQCVLEDITIIGELRALQVLSFHSSNIVRLPRELGQLTRLQLLDLSHCQRLEVIPSNVLSSLNQLEELYMGNSFLQWEVEVLNSQRNNANLAELKLLSNLVTLEIHIENANTLPKDLLFEKLERFKIFIGEDWDWSGRYETSRTVKLNLNTGIQVEEGVKLLLQRTEDLYLDEIKGVKSLLYKLDGQGFPQLKHLHVQNSHEIQFIVDFTCMSPFVAFPNLESLFLDNMNNLEKMCHGKLTVKSFNNLRILRVGSCNKLKNLFSFCMAKRLLLLEEIDITYCKMMEEIVAEESKDIIDKDETIQLPQLHTLALQYLPQFTTFCFNVKAFPIPQTGQKQSASDAMSKEIASENEVETHTLLFNEKVLFPNIKKVTLYSINIETIWHNQLLEMSSSFQNLASLIVDGCGNLKFVLSSSMVKSLVQLKKLDVCNCERVEEIIATEVSREEITSKMLLCELDYLKLRDLPKLIRFCTSNIECPALKVLWIENCPELKTFICDSTSTNIRDSSKPETTNFTLFDEKVAFPNLEELRIVNMNGLKMIWNNKLNFDSFCKLKLLEVKIGKELLTIFPSKMLRRIQNLETLFISKCDLIEEVFDLQRLMGMEETVAEMATPLRIMNLWTLPNLKHVWKGNSQGNLSFQNLHFVRVLECPSLKSLFPASVARGLLQLEELKIDMCGVKEIVAKEEGVEAALSFVFPKVTSLLLWKLPELKTFYPGAHTSEWPMLKKSEVYKCDKMEIYGSDVQNNQIQQPLFSFRRVIPKLEFLTLNNKDATMICQSQAPACLFKKLKVVGLYCFHDESTTFPLGLLQKFQNMEGLLVINSYFKELFPRELLGEDTNARTLTRIRYMKLDLLPCIMHIWNQDSPQDQILQNLEILKVRYCHRLTNLAPSSVSFQNLMALYVWSCNELINLMASSTAKSLEQLTVMSVKKCNMVAEIVTKEEEGAKHEIIFRKLKSLTLYCLTNLNSFCSAYCIFKFPSLKQLIVIHCPKMEIFSLGILSTPKLQRVQVTEDTDKGRWEGELNATIQQLYAERDVNAVEDFKELSLGDGDTFADDVF